MKRRKGGERRVGGCGSGRWYAAALGSTGKNQIGEVEIGPRTSASASFIQLRWCGRVVCHQTRVVWTSTAWPCSRVRSVPLPSSLSLPPPPPPLTSPTPGPA